MHGDVVPTEMQTARAEGTVRLDPVLKNSRDHGFELCFQLREAAAQQQAQIDALSAIVKLALVNSQARSFGKRFWESVAGKEIVEIIINALCERFFTTLVPG